MTSKEKAAYERSGTYIKLLSKVHNNDLLKMLKDIISLSGFLVAGYEDKEEIINAIEKANTLSVIQLKKSFL